MLVYSPSEGKWLEAWRSCWMRSSMTTSASASADLRSCETFTPRSVNQCGTRVEGPTSVTSASSLVSAQMLERATRLKRMSPRITTLRPFNAPRCSFIVKVSSSACVGCSWAPSPALMTGMLSRRLR